MSFAQQVQRAQQDIAFIALPAEVAALLHQTSALVLLRTKEAKLLAHGLQAPTSERLSQAHIQNVRRELATAKTRTVALIAKLEQATYPTFLARGKADSLAELQTLNAHLDALANFPELTQVPAPEPTPAPAPEPPAAPAPENPPQSADILPTATPEDPQQLG
ncbi:MAG: hypothetical protein Q8T09_01660 [Candidatus Melainabacteria bacterium]|nr:hypothetical protein [Candidatus Melainabacteria bacterium]